MNHLNQVYYGFTNSQPNFSLFFCLVSPVHPNVSQGCQGGCATCSDYNGCLSCKPRLFFVLERIGMKQIGVCLSSCPSGYYGTRYPDINKCTKCKADCDTCFNKNFCTKCKSGFYLHLGKCLDSCPEGLEANNHTMECISIVHCEASDWSPWSPCMKKGKTCGFKRGTETRVREILQHPSAKGNLCPPTSETRTCIVQRKKCSKGERGTDTLTNRFELSRMFSMCTMKSNSDSSGKLGWSQCSVNSKGLSWRYKGGRCNHKHCL
ncbi:Rspo3 [Phodopus roborovskii]|uniref:R-spondin-3 n=1 Tax=Phodopus roborovskii TaxID=109678 RepID=A0AAU9YU01_PHORO|nr:Rspo3 [Phodopus roborovskii]